MNFSIHGVVTHTAPSFTEPLTKKGVENFFKIDETIAQDFDNERAEVDKLFSWLRANNHPVTNWHYGHFHYSALSHHKGCTLSPPRHHGAKRDAITIQLLQDIQQLTKRKIVVGNGWSQRK